jgi:hypothetical protein
MKSFSLKSFVLRWISLLALAALTACGGTGSDGQLPKVFTATLNGAEETPPNNSPGKGVGTLVFHPGDRTFTATVVTSGVAETVAHIHDGPPGVAGPIIFPLTKEPGSVQWKATGTLTPEQEAKLRAGNYYFNVHSATFPDGEIRGQITERALTPEQQQMLQQRVQEASGRLQTAQQQIQQAAQQQIQQAAQQQIQQAAQQTPQQPAAAGAAGSPGAAGTTGTTGTTGGGTPGMAGTGTTAP